MRLVTVARFARPFEADLALAILADADIPARSSGGYPDGLRTFFTGEQGAIRIEVPQDLAAEARAILAATNDHERSTG